jgi:hypothetical protein
MRLLLIATICFSPMTAHAETAMTAQEFDAYSYGKVLTYAEGGTVYGTEEYLSDRRVRWAFTQRECEIGTWYGTPDHQICFVYGSQAEPQCWMFYAGSAGLKAKSMAQGSTLELHEVIQTDAALSCAGPDTGA